MRALALRAFTREQTLQLYVDRGLAQLSAYLQRQESSCPWQRRRGRL